MTITYPISLPSGAIITSRARHINNVSVTRSVFTGESQKQRYPGERLEFDLTVTPRSYTQARAWRGLLVQLFGQYGTFLYGDPDYLAQGPAGSYADDTLITESGDTLITEGGDTLISDNTVTVNGAHSALAATLNVTGLPASRTGALLQGDFIQLGSGSSARLHMILEDADSDASGNAALSIWPRLRTAYSDGAAVTIEGAMGVFELSAPATEYESNWNSVFSFGLSIREAL